ncbi:hypothetical protein DOTSEDRAFT_72904 [Dothistroma septosporum NZE10]|uniref:Uncharacterized protein n=1 Tax=Dothistroma septosporum (strain NZE10 / CBS 128990) TaxID=675120 RepID=M2WNW5_DOTSN|nr:hypothetical protein DOTSEDRAFT_72904 [Dothistroma septosporum NZE10]
MPWFSWYASYGDLGGILGRMARNLGLIIADSGLLLRLQELDDAKKTDYNLQVADKNGLLWLSEDPVKVMEFLDLSPTRFFTGFSNVEEMYAWLGQSRLAAPNVLRIKRNISVDRQKQNKRTIYGTFIDTWLPNHLALPAERPDPTDEEYAQEKADLRIKRERYRDEALDTFGQRAEFITMRDALVLSINNQIAKHLIRPIVAKHSGSKDLKLSEINRAFGRWVGFDESGKPCVKKEAHSDENSELHYFLNDDNSRLRDEEEVDEFVEKHWEELKYLERERAKGMRQERDGGLERIEQ